MKSLWITINYHKNPLKSHKHIIQITMTSPWNIRGSTWTGGGPSCESTRCTASWRWSRPRPLTLAIHVVYNHLIVTCIIISAYIYSYYIWLYIYIYIYTYYEYTYIYTICVCGLCGIVGHCGALWSPCRPRSASLVAVFAQHDTRDKKGITDGLVYGYHL